MSSNPLVAKGLRRLFDRRGEFILIGLTGRTGSGCTTAAKVLSQHLNDLQLPEPTSESPKAEDRKYKIIKNYVDHNWQPFFSISISNIILSFLLDENEESIKIFFKQSNLLKSSELDEFVAAWTPAAKAWIESRNILFDIKSEVKDKSKFLNSWKSTIIDFFKVVRTGLGPASTKILQTIGDNIRKSGNPFESKHDPSNFYLLPERISLLIDLVRDVQRSIEKPTYIVLDALRNPFELLYFRERFPAFYVFAISTPNDDRERRLSLLDFTAKQIVDLDHKEYPEKNSPLSGYDAFTSQNIQSCLEKADVYINNSGFSPQDQIKDIKSLTQQLVKYFSLILHPGLVTPTRSERCMQIAFTARANSGCISRQVGAAITDEHDSVKAVGWNDVPAGQVPCLLRAATDLLDNQDSQAFSEYEYKDAKFRKEIEGTYKKFKLVETNGRSSAFCFKTAYNTLTNTKNQVHTRSLHAEENAFLQIVKQGGQGISGGKLYTTASPCELCAKKAFQLGIRHIYFIDPYPGISLKHILQSGAENSRPKVELYQGAVGSAYHRMYDPILPYKDELQALMEGEHSVKTAERPAPESRLL